MENTYRKDPGGSVGYVNLGNEVGLGGGAGYTGKGSEAGPGGGAGYAEPGGGW